MPLESKSACESKMDMLDLLGIQIALKRAEKELSGIAELVEEEIPTLRAECEDMALRCATFGTALNMAIRRMAD